MLNRTLQSLTLLLLAAGAAFPQGGNDTVRYRDKGADVTRTGDVKEVPGGISFTFTGKTSTIFAKDIIAVYYGKLAGIDDKVRIDLPNLDSKSPAEALAKYSELLKDSLTATDERSKRFLEYKVAYWTARQADALGSDEFKKAAPAAVEKLGLFGRANPKAWESWSVMTTMARLQGELGKHNEAASTLAGLGKAEGMPEELKNEAKLLELEAILRSGSALFADNAIASANSLTKLTPAQTERLAMVKLALQASKDRTDANKLKAAAKAMADLIEKSAEPANRAAAHNLLGEVYMQAKLNAEAKWQFLWVEAVDYVDQDELVKALNRLGEVFEALGDKDRAAAYREKAVKAKGV